MVLNMMAIIVLAFSYQMMKTHVIKLLMSIWIMMSKWRIMKMNPQVWGDTRARATAYAVTYINVQRAHRSQSQSQRNQIVLHSDFSLEVAVQLRLEQFTHADFLAGKSEHETIGSTHRKYHRNTNRTVSFIRKPN